MRSRVRWSVPWGSAAPPVPAGAAEPPLTRLSGARATFRCMPAPAPFCAICTEPAPPGTTLPRRPLGKDGALVAVCTDCDTLHPRSGRYAFNDGGGRATPITNTSNLGNGNHRRRIR